MFWITQFLRKLNKYKRHFFDRLLYQDHTNFYVYHRLNNKPNDMWKNYILCWIAPKKIKVLLAFSWFPTYTDSVLLPGFPLLERSGMQGENFNEIQNQSNIKLVSFIVFAYCFTEQNRIHCYTSNEASVPQENYWWYWLRMHENTIPSMFFLVSFKQINYFVSIISQNRWYTTKPK